MQGNAGFYEIGCMETPLGKGFSVLGWNHPGFGGSTGTPWPQKVPHPAPAEDGANDVGHLDRAHGAVDGADDVLMMIMLSQES